MIEASIILVVLLIEGYAIGRLIEFGITKYFANQKETAEVKG